MARTVACAQCGAENPADGRFCVACDELLVAAPGAEGAAKLALANPTQRLIAAIIDGILLGIAVRIMRQFPLGGSLATVMWLGYFVYFTGSTGQTIGKRVMGIQVRKADGRPLEFGGAAIREVIGKFISGLIFGLGYLWMLWDGRSQGWHDKLAGTVVVKTSGDHKLPRPVRQLRRSVEAWNVPSTDIRQTIRTSIDQALTTSSDAIASWAQRERPDLSGQVAPDGTVTILFADAVDEEAMQADGALRADVALLVAGEVDRHGGYEVKAADGAFMVAFRSARRAVQCAASIQRAVAVHRDTHPGTVVRLRIGLHTGEVLRDEGEFFDRNVVVASRIADRARGGQILVSSLLRSLTESSGDFEFDEGTEVELPDVPGTFRVYEVSW